MLLVKLLLIFLHITRSLNKNITINLKTKINQVGSVINYSNNFFDYAQISDYYDKQKIARLVVLLIIK